MIKVGDRIRVGEPLLNDAWDYPFIGHVDSIDSNKNIAIILDPDSDIYYSVPFNELEEL